MSQSCTLVEYVGVESRACSSFAHTEGGEDSAEHIVGRLSADDGFECIDRGSELLSVQLGHGQGWCIGIDRCSQIIEQLTGPEDAAVVTVEYLTDGSGVRL